MKICNVCLENKDVLLFNKDKYTKDGYTYTCKTCAKNRSSLRYKSKTKECLAQSKKYKFEHKDYYTKYISLWQKEHKENVAIRNKKWRQKNKSVCNAQTYKYRTSKLKALPAWANLDKIKEFYKQAEQLTKETGVLYTVDHIIPLRSHEVCGLHVEHNLQVLLGTENFSKGNKLYQRAFEIVK